MNIDFRWIPKSTGCGIYAIINTFNLTVYVGCTRNLRRRAQSHKYSIESGKHANNKLQKAAEKGIIHFIVLEELPEDVSDSIMSLKEMMYILDFCKRPKYTVCNREAENVDCLESKIIFDLGRYWKVEENVKEKFKESYGTEPWNMAARNEERRVV